jgi:hypothetical protein
MMRDTVVGYGAPKPRPSRQGYKLYDWPKEDLAVVFRLNTRNKGKALLAAVENSYPDIGRRYFESTGRPLTVNVLVNRVDKGKRYNEMRNYEHLLYEAQ